MAFHTFNMKKMKRMSKNIVDLFIALGFFILFTVFGLALRIAVELQIANMATRRIN